MPEITVVIPTFNRAELLRKAVNSVLAQTDVDLEVVISDNCSDDHTPQVAAEFQHDLRVRYFRNERNIGMVGNWKRAIFEHSQSDWFVLMSDDDFFTDPTYLGEASRAISLHRPAVVYAGGVVQDVVAGSRQVLRLPFNGLVPGDKVFASRGTVAPQDMILCNIVFNKAAAARLNFLSDPNNLSCDSELHLKLCAEGQVYAFATPVCVYLKHGSNLGNRIRRSRVLLDHNIDHLLNPYLYARERDLDSASIASFRRNTQLDRHISTTLLLLRLHDERWHEECRTRLFSKAPELVREIELSSTYRFWRLAMSVARPYVIRSYPLRDESPNW